MSCNFPLIRAETYETYVNQKGGKSYKAEFINRDEYDRFGKDYLKHKYRKVTPIGCGQCIGCLLDRSRDRATQMMCEKYYGYNHGTKENPSYGAYPDGTTWFITCTYADEYLKTHKTVNTETGEVLEGISLNVEDHQKFMKRLRKKFKTDKIKFVCAGEYGNSTLRPHLHYIIYGLKLPTETFKKIHMNAMNQPTWYCDELTEIWGMGHVEIGRVDWRSCAYVARYCVKKAGKRDAEWYQAQGMLPEFIIWSNEIGRKYFEEHKDEIYKTDSVPISTHMGGLLRTPKSYDRLLKETDPELYESVKQKRESAAITKEFNLRSQTDYTPEERRAIAEARMQAVMKDIRTEV